MPSDRIFDSERAGRLSGGEERQRQSEGVEVGAAVERLS
jgi:hypothetical protein